MFEPNDSLDLKKIALKVASEPAVKEDGSKLLVNGKEISKVEKIIRDWAVSPNPDLQKRFVDITKEELLEKQSLDSMVFLTVLACTGTDEIRQNILKKLEKYEDSADFEKAINDAKLLGAKAASKVAVYLPENGRDKQ